MIHHKLSKAEIGRIRIFDTVMKTKSMSQTALALNVSHSSVYLAIKKLRLLYNDVLFIRDKSLLVPTEFAKRLHTESLAILKNQQEIQPAHVETDKHRFIFACAPHIAATVIPVTYLLMEQSILFPLEHMALPVSPEARIDLLLNNKADVIFDYEPIQHEDIFFKRLFKEDYAIVCRNDHPRLSNSISLKEFSYEKQAALGCSSSIDNLIDTENVFFASHYYLDLLAMVEVSDIICVIPLNIYLKLHASFDIKPLNYKFKLNVKKTCLYINYLKDPSRQKDKNDLLKKIEMMR
jgi:DNA-binding transcriptional LysR family regulator